MMYGLLVLIVVLSFWLFKRNWYDPVRVAQSYRKEENAPLSSAQIQLIRDSWQRVLPMKVKAAELFYGRLFELDPAVKPLFRGKLDFQGDKLMTTLNVIINSLDDLAAIEAMLQAMGKRHIIYGVEVAHYETVGAALLWVLEQGLQDDFTEEVKEAWSIAYGLVATTMIEAAYAEES
jgi:hemoglobin-like flavoprotein